MNDETLLEEVGDNLLEENGNNAEAGTAANQNSLMAQLQKELEAAKKQREEMEKKLKKQLANRSDLVNLALRADAECAVHCDGDFLFILEPGKIQKEQVQVGQHILEFVSTEDQDVKVEKVVDYPTADKNYVLIINEFSAIFELKKAKAAEEKAAKEAEAKRKEEEKAAKEAEARRKAEEEAKRKADAEEEKTFNVKGISFVMKQVEGGTFQMGATPEQMVPFDDEKPVHDVTLSSYYIGQTQVTQALWTAVMGTNPSNFQGNDSRPVECVSWEDCQEFINRLNQLTGQKFRLPTEAEWEFAARGGNKSWGCQYAGSNDLDAVAWYNEAIFEGATHPVAMKRANELGLYDMSGNVWEWCQDWKGEYSSSPVTNPTGPKSGSGRVNRGGSWISNARNCRVAKRNGNTPTYQDNILGLRLAL